jgi:hypothetical protein
MIICLDTEEQAGTVIDGDYFFTPEECTEIRIMLLRPATQEEWVAYRRSQNLPAKGMINPRLPFYFWHVSTD